MSEMLLPRSFAADEATAFRAAAAIKMDYEPLPSLMTIDEALAAGRSDLI